MKKISLSKKHLVLGAEGFLGSRLYARLKKEGLEVYGTSRKKSDSNMFFLDTRQTDSVERFSWADFNVIIDCVGSIEYGNDEEAVEKNILTNVLGPISIISRLLNNQRYYYLSTHAVFLPMEKHNSYSLSKLFFEQLINKMENKKVGITMVRMPAIFSEERENGLLYKIKKSFFDKKHTTIDFVSAKWHTMSAERAIEILSKIVLSNRHFKEINIGYPAEYTIDNIISCAENVFGGHYVSLGSVSTDHYIPDLTGQNKICRITPLHMNKDLKLYFKLQ